MSLRNALACAYERLPLALDPPLDTAKHLLVTCAKVRMPIVRLTGPHPQTGRPMRVIAVDEQPSMTYFLRHMVGDDPVRERIGSTPWWSLGDTLDGLRDDADAIAVRIDRRLGELFFERAALRLPEAVTMTLQERHTGGVTERAQRSQARNLRAIRRNRLTWYASTDDREFDRWYDQWYVPFVRERFGEDGYLRSRHRLRRYRDRALLWVCHEGRPVTGELLAVHRGRLEIMVGGAQDIDLSRKTGAGVAAYKFSLEYAQQRGLREVEMGGCRPSLTDGVLTHKKRWGGGIELTNRLRHDIVIDWPRWSPEVFELLRKTAPIVREGSLCIGITAARADDDHESLNADLNLPGLDRIVIYGEDGKVAATLAGEA